MKHSILLTVTVLLLLTQTSFGQTDVKLKVRQTIQEAQIETTTYIKGRRERTEMDMGAPGEGGMKMVTIRQCDLKRTIRLSPMTEMYIIDSWASNESLVETSNTVARGPSGDTATSVRTDGVVTITISMRDTGERKKVFGFNARRIIMTTQMQSSADSCDGANSMKTEVDGWYIDADFAFECEDPNTYRNEDPTRRRNRGSDCKDRYEIKTTGASAKPGYPVYEKITMFDRSGKPTTSFVKEVVELSYAKLDPALFEAPAGWSQAKNEMEMFTGGGFDPAQMMGGASRESKAGGTQSGGTKPVQQTTPARPNIAESAAGPDGMIGKVRAAAYAGEKEAGKIRIGLSGVKAGSAGEGMNPEALAGAIQNLFGEYFVGTGVELVLLEAKLPSAIENEAREAGCDFVLFATVSHKRGGGGLGALRVIGDAVGRNIPYGGSRTEQIGSDLARVAAYEVGDAAASVKPKDELTLDINLKRLDGAGALTRQFKQKASSQGENIMSPTVEKAAQAIVDFATK